MDGFLCVTPAREVASCVRLQPTTSFWVCTLQRRPWTRPDRLIVSSRLFWRDSRGRGGFHSRSFFIFASVSLRRSRAASRCSVVRAILCKGQRQRAHVNDLEAESLALGDDRLPQRKTRRRAGRDPRGWTAIWNREGLLLTGSPHPVYASSQQTKTLEREYFTSDHDSPRQKSEFKHLPLASPRRSSSTTGRNRMKR